MRSKRLKSKMRMIMMILKILTTLQALSGPGKSYQAYYAIYPGDQTLLNHDEDNKMASAHTLCSLDMHTSLMPMKSPLKKK